jgi:hypothetical protein
MPALPAALYLEHTRTQYAPPTWTPPPARVAERQRNQRVAAWLDQAAPPEQL